MSSEGHPGRTSAAHRRPKGYPGTCSSDIPRAAAAATCSNCSMTDPVSTLRLTEETVALLMRLLMAGQITRPVAHAFVAPWVEGDLPSSGLAHSGALYVHGFDLVGDWAGRVWHAPSLSDDHEYLFDRDEMVRRCEAWLEEYRLTQRAKRRA